MILKLKATLRCTIAVLCIIATSIATAQDRDETELMISDNPSPDSVFAGLSNQEIHELLDRRREEQSRRTNTISATEIERVALQLLNRSIVTQDRGLVNSLNLLPDQLSVVQEFITPVINLAVVVDATGISAMCETWNESKLGGDDKIDEALASFDIEVDKLNSSLGTETLIAIDKIQTYLQGEDRAAFDEYMDIHRKMLSNVSLQSFSQSAVSFGQPLATIQYHCGG